MTGEAPRTRTRGAGPLYDNGEFHDPNSDLVVILPTYLSFVSEEEMTDVITPSFNERIAAGEVINNEMSYSKEMYTAEPEDVFVVQLHNPTGPEDGTRVFKYGNFTAESLQRCSYYGYDVNPIELTFDTIQQARSKALANVDSTPYEFLEDMLEIKETIKFLRSPLASISNVARAFRRKHDRAQNIKDQTTRIRELANLWKQYRFAFAPLLRSAMTIMEALADKDMTRPVRRNAHGYAFDKKDHRAFEEPWIGGVGTQVVFQYQANALKDRQTHAAVLYEVSNPVYDNFFKLGLRLKDLPVGLWEIYPLSFMVDRLWNIKNMISGFMNLADPDLTILAGSVTDRIDATHDISLVGKYMPYEGITTWTIGRPDHVYYKKYTQVRTPWAISVADIVPPLTPGNLVSDISKILDLLSIILGKLPNSR